MHPIRFTFRPVIRDTFAKKGMYASESRMYACNACLTGSASTHEHGSRLPESAGSLAEAEIKQSRRTFRTYRMKTKKEEEA